jgi:hypothetical protein
MLQNIFGKPFHGTGKILYRNHFPRLLCMCIMYTFVNSGECKGVQPNNKDTGKLICTGFRMDIILYEVRVC